MLTRCVVFATRSRTNTSVESFVSFGTRFVASDENATYRPSALIAGSFDASSATAPPMPTLTSVWLPVTVSQRHTPSSTPGEDVSVWAAYAMYRPSADSAGGVGAAPRGSFAAGWLTRCVHAQPAPRIVTAPTRAMALPRLCFTVRAPPVGPPESAPFYAWRRAVPVAAATHRGLGHG